MVAVGILLHHQLVVSKIDSKCTNGNAESGEGRLEAVIARELSLVSPGVSLGPRVGAHGLGQLGEKSGIREKVIGGGVVHRQSRVLMHPEARMLRHNPE